MVQTRGLQPPTIRYNSPGGANTVWPLSTGPNVLYEVLYSLYCIQGTISWYQLLLWTGSTAPIVEGSLVFQTWFFLVSESKWNVSRLSLNEEVNGRDCSVFEWSTSVKMKYICFRPVLNYLWAGTGPRIRGWEPLLWTIEAVDANVYMQSNDQLKHNSNQSLVWHVVDLLLASKPKI